MIYRALGPCLIGLISSLLVLLSGFLQEAKPGWERVIGLAIVLASSLGVASIAEYALPGSDKPVVVARLVATWQYPAALTLGLALFLDPVALIGVGGFVVAVLLERQRARRPTHVGSRLSRSASRPQLIYVIIIAMAVASFGVGLGAAEVSLDDGSSTDYVAYLTSLLVVFFGIFGSTVAALCLLVSPMRSWPRFVAYVVLGWLFMAALLAGLVVDGQRASWLLLAVGIGVVGVGIVSQLKLRLWYLGRDDDAPTTMSPS